MLSHFVAVCLALLPFARCMQIHEHMTEDEVSKTFQTRHDNVPGYELVRIYHTLHKRDIFDDSTPTVRLNTHNRNFSLYLEPNDGLLVGESTPVWTVVERVGYPDGTKYTRNREVLRNIGKAYHDVSRRSAIVTYEGEDGETLFHGTLMENFIVRPLPYRLHNAILRERRDLVDSLPEGVDGNTDFRRSHYHVVFERPDRDTNTTNDGIRVVERERRVPRRSRTHDPSKISVPNIIYPEILIIVDFHLYEIIGRNVEEAVRYVLAFWNAVDLRYRLLENPVVRLYIAGIIISLEPRGTPYLENARRNSTNINADQGMEAMGLYLYTKSDIFPFNSYDIAVAMTRLDICRTRPNGVCDTNVQGVAYHARACMINYFRMANDAMVLVEDNGGFTGIFITTHEVAHSMGVFHDGSKHSKDCFATDGHIMSPTTNYGENAIQWSLCSLKHLYAFLSTPQSICLRNLPPASKALHHKLPGELLGVDEQCEKIRGTKGCWYDDRVCNALACFRYEGDNRCDISQNAAEGTPCGEEKYCINGYCVSKNVEYLPTEYVYEIRTGH